MIFDGYLNRNLKSIKLKNRTKNIVKNISLKNFELDTKYSFDKHWTYFECVKLFSKAEKKYCTPRTQDSF